MPIFRRLQAKIISVLFAASLLTVLFACTPIPSRSTESTANKPQSIRVVMDNNYPPYTFLDEEGNLQGILVDQWRLWEKQTGIQVELVGMDWAKAQESMHAGEFDVIDTVFLTDERLTWLDFTRPYARINAAIFYKNNISGLIGPQSLKGFRVAVKEGDAAVDYLLNAGVTDLVYYNSYAEIVQAASEGNVNIFVIDQPPALYFLYKDKVEDQFHYSPPLYSGEFHRAVAIGNTELLDTIQAGFDSISAGQYEAIQDKWLGNEPSILWQRYAPLMVGAILLIAAIITGLLLFSRTLQTRVRERTRDLEAALADLRQTDDRLSAIFSAATDVAFVITDADEQDPHIVEFSPGAERIFGYSRSEIIGQSISILHPSDMHGRIPQVSLSLQQSRSGMEEEITLRRKSGETFPALLSTHPMLDASGKMYAVLGIGFNITNLKQTEEALRESQNLSENIMAATPSLVYVYDLEKKAPVFMNDAVQSILGYSREEILGKDSEIWAHLFHPDDLQKVLEHIAWKVGQNDDETSSIEYRARHKNGQWRWFTGRDKILKRNPEGHAIQIVGVATDITEQKNVQDALKASQERWMFALDGSGQGVWDWNMVTGEAFYTHYYKEMLGYADDEYENTHAAWEEHLHPDDFERVTKNDLASLQIKDRIHVVEFRLRCKDGSYRWVLSRGKVMEWSPEGKALRMVGTHTDITEQKLAEQRLKESEARYRRIIETASEGIWIYDENRVTTFVNRRMAEMLGLDESEMIGKHLAHFIFKDDVSSHEEQMKSRISGNKGKYRQRFRKPNGETIWCLVSSAPFMNDENQFQGAIAMLTDITDWKRAEEELIQSEAKFRAFVQQASEGIEVVDQNGIVIEWNQAMEKIVGIPAREAIGCHYWEFQKKLMVPERQIPEYMDDLQKRIEDTLQNPDSELFSREHEYPIRTVTGETRLIRQILFPIKVEDGYYLGAVTRDITLQKQAEAVILESERRFRSMMENLALFAIMLDAQGNITFCNDFALKVTGYSLNEVIGKNWFDYFLPPGDLLREIFLQSASNGSIPLHYENPVVTKSGETRLVSWNNTILRDPAGQFIGTASIGEDITEQTRIIQALKDRQARLNSIFSASQIGIGVIQNRVMLDINEKVCEISGYPRNELVGYSSRKLYPTQAEFLRVGEALQPAIDQRKSIMVESKWRRKDGKLIDVLISFTQLDPDDPGAGWASTVMDITDQKAYENKIQTANQELQRAYNATLEGWSNALELRERETAGHSQRVVGLTLNIAKKMGVPPEKLEHVRRGALLHDIGKMGIPDNILLKPGPLTADEWVIMRQHPLYSYQLLHNIQYLSPALDIPYCHHERWNGSGYPRGLIGESIPLAARIFAVVDVWDALTSDRPYRPAWNREATRTYILEQSGIQFDPRVVEIFIQMLDNNEINAGEPEE